MTSHHGILPPALKVMRQPSCVYSLTDRGTGATQCTLVMPFTGVWTLTQGLTEGIMSNKTKRVPGKVNTGEKLEDRCKTGTDANGANH